MKVTKILGVVAATLLMCSQVFAENNNDLTDSRKVGVIDSFQNCVQTAGGLNVCGDTCVEFDGNKIVSHDHDCIRDGRLKASNYKGAKAKAVRTLLRNHAYLTR